MVGVPLRLAGTARQEPFARVAPLLRSALVTGPCGGFLFAAILTISAAFHLNTGAWWIALAQAHGHLQLYGWAGLFVLGVALHFLPRLRGAPLAAPQLIAWIVGLQVTSIIVRGVSQPLAATSSSGIWRFGLIVSGVLEALAFGLVLLSAGTTFRHGLPLAKRPALLKIIPFLAIAFASLGLAAIVNLIDMFDAARTAPGIVLNPGDTLNVTLGLFGFFVPVALAMSAQALPMYAGLKVLSRRTLWSLAGVYVVGLLLYLTGIISGALSDWTTVLIGLGWIGLGGALLACVIAFIYMIRSRGKIPSHIARLSSAPEQMEHSYRTQIATQRENFGPFVALVASAYLWALVAGALLCLDGISMLANGTTVVAVDAIRHSLTIGFLTLLISGIAPRMLTAFSGGNIASPAFVTATLWLGNAAALLRVGSILLIPFMGGASTVPDVLFGLSGPLGLAVAICLTINLWPALSGPRATEKDAL
ncbi:MAG TPA: hypothetical protein VF510_24740 [Ktedonobacterales bacterium]